MKNLIESVKRLAAPPSWDASFTPMITGFTCAFTVGQAKLTYAAVLWMLLAFFAIALIETGKHALNEILDYETGADLVLQEDHVTPFSGGKKVMREGLSSVRQLWWVAVVTLGIASIIGLVISFSLNRKILVIGIIGMAMAILYNAPQTRFIYLGLGEPCIFIAYGPVCTLGAYYMFADRFSMIPLLASFALGFLIVNVLIMNEYPDFEADISAGKKNWLVRLGKEKGTKLYSTIYYLHYIPLLMLLVITKSPLWLLPFLNQFLFLRVMRGMKANLNNIPNLIPTCADTITLHSRCGMYMNTVLVMLFLISL